MTRKFKAAVAYYPTCSPNDGDATVPTLIMIGELNDWGPPALCRQRLENLSGSGPDGSTCIRSPRGVPSRPQRKLPRLERLARGQLIEQALR